MTWLHRHASAIEAGAALLTAVTAVLAVAGVLLQMRAAEATSQAQTAREAFAAHLALAAGSPDFAAPSDPCPLIASPRGAAYTAFVDHLLYAAEQMLAVDPDWDATFQQALAPHAALLCMAEAEEGVDPSLARTLTQFRAGACAAAPQCEDAG